MDELRCRLKENVLLCLTLVVFVRRRSGCWLFIILSQYWNWQIRICPSVRDYWSTVKPCPVSTLSQKSETVSQKWDCRRKRRNSATVALLCDSLTFLRQCGLDRLLAEAGTPTTVTATAWSVSWVLVLSSSSSSDVELRVTSGRQPVAERNFAVPIGFNNQWLSLNGRACLRAWQAGPGRPHRFTSAHDTQSWSRFTSSGCDSELLPLIVITSQLTCTINERPFMLLLISVTARTHRGHDW